MVIDLKNEVLHDMILRWLNSEDLTVDLITEKIKDDPDEGGSTAGITKKAAESLLAMRNGMWRSTWTQNTSTFPRCFTPWSARDRWRVCVGH